MPSRRGAAWKRGGEAVAGGPGAARGCALGASSQPIKPSGPLLGHWGAVLAFLTRLRWWNRAFWGSEELCRVAVAFR